MTTRDRPSKTIVRAPSDNDMTVGTAADLLGMSPSTVRRRDGELLHPERDPKGARRYKRTEVLALKRTLQVDDGAGRDEADGDLTAEVFGRFDAGVHPVDVCIELRLGHGLVESLHKAWARMRGLLVISRAKQEEILKLVPGAKKEMSEEELVALVTEVLAADVRRCAGETDCVNEADYCESCTRAYAQRELNVEMARGVGVSGEKNAIRIDHYYHRVPLVDRWRQSVTERSAIPACDEDGDDEHEEDEETSEEKKPTSSA